ncbi:MAG TPA: isochorismatase family cysteine hydrolase [Stellaceae bacterium]|nr:isochorismatase family cysteine hydrolase [Stellaceae bacterium]
MAGGGLLVDVRARLDPRHTALLVIDMQNDFCAEGGYVESVLKRDAAACRAVAAPIMELVAAARRAQVPVIWVVADYSLDKIPAGMRIKAAERGVPPACGSGGWGAAFYELTPAPGETTIEKNCYSGFIGTRLAAHLRGLGIRTLVFAGVQTNVCVESTLRDGASLGFHVVLAADCVASHMQSMHEATLQLVAMLFGDVLPRRKIAEHWRASAISG